MTRHVDPSVEARALWLREARESASQVFGNEVDADAWLVRPAPALGFRTPMAVIQHPEGVELVRVLLGRIEYCVYT